MRRSNKCRSMTPSEIIMATIAAAALIVAWLARLEAKVSACAAKKSADEAQKANDLMARQLELATNAQNRQRQREIAESRPLLAWRSSGGAENGQNFTGQYFEFTNHGAAMSNPKVVADNGFEAWIEPRDVIPTNQKGRLIIKWPKAQLVPKTANISIEFSDLLNERRVIGFRARSQPEDRYFSFPLEEAS
jgi:hypothetical protein